MHLPNVIKAVEGDRWKESETVVNGAKVLVGTQTKSNIVLNNLSLQFLIFNNIIHSLGTVEILFRPVKSLIPSMQSHVVSLIHDQDHITQIHRY